jgi:hypothetical protein
MASTLRNQYLSNWNQPKNNVDKPFFNDENYDSPISERTSMASTMDDYPPSPTKSQEKAKRSKHPNTLRYSYNELPTNGIPLATQHQIEKEENKKNNRKAPPGQGKLVPLPDNSTTNYENYYPYTRYYQTKNEEKISRTKEKVNHPTVDHDDIDVTPYLPDQSSRTTSIKSSRRSKKKKKKTSRRQRDNLTNDSKFSSSSTHFIPLKDSDDGDTNTSSNRKLQSRHRHHRHRHHHHHHHNNLSTLPPLPTSQPKTPIDDPYVPQRMYENSGFHVIDDSYKRTERSPFILGNRQSYQLPPPAVYNQSSYLPPIEPSYPIYYRPLYYFGQESKENRPEPQVYKPDTQTRFYDRYLNDVIEKRLTAL